MRKREDPFICPHSKNELWKNRKIVLCTAEKYKCPLGKETGEIPMETAGFFKKYALFFRDALVYRTCFVYNRIDRYVHF